MGFSYSGIFSKAINKFSVEISGIYRYRGRTYKVLVLLGEKGVNYSLAGKFLVFKFFEKYLRVFTVKSGLIWFRPIFETKVIA